MRRIHRAIALVPFVLTPLMLGVQPAGATVSYTVTDLGTLGEGSTAYAINESGQVAGVSQPTIFDEYGFFWDDGVMTGIHPMGGKRAYAYDLSDSGMVIGGGNTSDGRHVAFYWLGQDPHPMGTLGGANSEARATGVLRHTVGWSEVAPGSNEREAFLWAGTMIGLGRLSDAGDSIAEDINAHDVVVGRAEVAPNVWHAFVHDGEMRDLGVPTPNFNQTEAYGINDDGVIVGRTRVVGGGGVHPFVQHDGWWDVITEVAGTAFAVNNQGVVVGESFTPAGEVGFVYRDGTLTDLNTVIPAGTGWQIGPAYDINEAGQIVGSGILNGEGRAYLLTPTGSTADLGVTMTASPNPLLAGTSATFVASITNHGPATATDVALSVGLPVNQTSSTCSAPGGTCAGTGSAWTVTFASLAPGAGASATFEAGSPASASHGAAYQAMASVSATQHDPVPSNDQSAASVTISNRADLAVSGSVDRRNAKAGQTLTYTWSVANAGPGGAGSTVFEFVEPSGLNLVSAGSSVGSCNVASGAVRCELGTVPSGSAADITVDAVVTAGGGESVTSTATVASVNHDPILSNNAASVSLDIKGKPR